MTKQVNDPQKIKIGGKEITLTINQLAKQTNASALAQMGETVVLATAVMGEPREDADFFPLSVDYEEHYWAAGKIRGSRFMKRKGRPTDEAILSGRLIDRSIRPLFPKGMRNQVQIIVNVLSFDFINDPRALAFVAVSAALEASDIPFNGPLAAVLISANQDKLILNPTIDEIEKEQVEIFIAGVGQNISMVEAGAREIPEEQVVRAINLAQTENQKISEFISQAVKKIAKPKQEVPLFLAPAELKQKLSDQYLPEFQKIFASYQDKQQYETDIKALFEKITRQQMQDQTESSEPDQDQQSRIAQALEEIHKKMIQSNVLDKGQRLGGRAMDQVRDLDIQVGLLPRTHGSALFQRGETQSLTTTTLGSPGSELILDGMTDEPEASQRYMHFYGFPPYSVGDTAPMRGPGRREIGHGALGEKSVKPVIPDKQDFPYTILMNTEILGSDGSTSMASVCGSTLALMQAGIPIKKPVAGVAMGLVVNPENLDQYQILTDLCANEDFAGHMDFKVAGTDQGITALQMDIKVQGLGLEILKKSLEQAKQGRLQILKSMLRVIDQPNKNISPHAPRVKKIQIDPEKIGDVIGPGGKVIKSIIEETGAQIDIENDGTVYITSVDQDSMKQALKHIQALTKEAAVGETYVGKVTRIMEFGAFVEFLPGQEGLIHISKLGQGQRVNRVRDVVEINEKVKVKIIEKDKLGRYNLAFMGKVKV
ncbi:MAG: polyribonucleotide nucleotidyltransferase [Candidatus Moranbacteria bacterium]|nr:polyribonucleotide nucleotidyltransferase [Candidatus Moranbacteria bacterium]